MSEPYQVARLSPAEVAFGLAIATQRDACKQNLYQNGAGLRNQRLSKTQSGFGVHFAGILGELCFRKVHGGEINQEIFPKGDGHEGDVIVTRKLVNGDLHVMPVEVKTSLYTGPDVDLKFEKDELEALLDRPTAHCALVQLFMPDTARVSPIWNIKDIVSSLVEKNYGNGTRYSFSPGGWL